MAMMVGEIIADNIRIVILEGLRKVIKDQPQLTNQLLDIHVMFIALRMYFSLT